MPVANKLELKNKLLADKKKLMIQLDTTSDDDVKKAHILNMLDMVNSYIDICIKRNRF